MNNIQQKKKKPNPVPPKKQVVKKTGKESSGFNQWIWLFGILALTFIVFFPSLNNALTNWDDPTYLNENPLIRSLSSVNIKRIFSEVYFGNYQPLHLLSYAIEYHFYKLNPVGYHTTSVIMHLITTGLVCWFIFSLTKNSTLALITTLLFGIHPLHVESVAWAAERKDLLYAIFFLSSLILYIKYIRSDEKIKYLVYAFLFFALSILSKAMAASLPPVLVLLDIYFGRKLSWKMAIEKIPFFALAIAIGMISATTAATTGQVSLNVFSLFERILIANFNILAYLFKLVVPINLSSYYPYPVRVNGSLPWYFFVAPVIVAGLAFLIIRSLKKTKSIFFAAGFFLLCILLVLQLFPVGPTMISERYSYLPSIGFFFIIAYFIQQMIKKSPPSKTPLYAVMGGYSLFLCVTTYQRCDVWKDSMTLWNNVLDQFPHEGMALNNRGNIYGKEMGQLDLALEDFNKSIFYQPGFENAYANRGIVYCMKGKFDLAIADFNKAIEIHPNYYEALVNRGIAYGQTNQADKAIADFTKLATIKNDDPLVYVNRGVVYSQSGKQDESLVDFSKAISLNPEYAEAYYRRASILYNKGRFKEAYDDVQRASGLGFNVDQKYFETIRQAAEKK